MKVKVNHTPTTHNFPLPKEKSVREIEIMLISICVIILLWILASYIDITMHNLSTYEYAWWNFFTNLIK